MHRWKFSAFAAAAVCAALAGTDAAALALGPLSVQSHLGSPLLAEIEITEITPAELASLQTRIASPDVFRAHGMDFNPAVRGIQVQLQRLADGQAKLRLSSTMALEQPFLDLVLDASWSSGNLVRSYTVLLDPAPTPAPAANSVQAASPGAVTRSTRSSGNVRPPAVTAPTASTAPAAPTRPARRVRATVPAPASAPAVASAPANGPKARVRTGDTAGQLVRPYAGKGASLDQMLLALLRANPQAFVDNNVNRLKAGAVLTLPTTADAQRTTAAEARRIIAAQSSDFNAYRRRLAQKAPRARVESAQRSAAGAVQAQVEDASPSAAPLDKLTLSKQGAPEQAQAEEQLAQAKQSAAQEQRLQELQRNLSDLQEVSGAVTSAAPTVEVDAHSASTGPSAPDAPNTQASGLVVDGQNPPAPEPNASAEAGEQAPPAPDPVAPPAVAEEAPDAQALAKAAEAEKLPTPTPKKSVWSNPLLWTAGGAGLVAVALAGGLLWYRRKKTGAAAGQSILAAAASQKAAAAPPEPEPEQDEPRTDVDPIAEADVYLAYGKDEEAQKILEQALEAAPQNQPLLVKLAEVHAKHHRLEPMQALARQVFELSQGQGPDWEQMRTLGQNLDPDNPLYAGGADAQAQQAGIGVAPSSFAQALASSQSANAGFDAGTSPDDLDLAAALQESGYGTEPAEPPAPAPEPVRPPGRAAQFQPSPQETLGSRADDAFSLDIDPEDNPPPPSWQAPDAAPEPAPAPRNSNAGNASNSAGSDDGLTDFASSLDLDLSTPDDADGIPDLSDVFAPEPAPEPAPAPRPAPPPEVRAPVDEASIAQELDFNFDEPAPAPTLEQPAHPAPTPAPAPTASSEGGGFGLDEIDFSQMTNLDDLDNGSPPDSSFFAPEPSADNFDDVFEQVLDDNAYADGSANANANASAPEPSFPSDEDIAADDPLSTKLDLAKEFASIGDTEGARALVEEVLAQADGAVRARAQQMLQTLAA